MKKINIACWSVGEHAQRNILPAISICYSVELIGLYTRNKVVKNVQSEKYNCKAYIDPQALLADERVDAVYISSPTSEHSAQIKACLLAGKSVLVEKTALANKKEVESFIVLAKEKGCFILEAFMYRFHEQYLTLEKIIRLKRFGEIKKLDCEFGFPHLNSDNIRYSKKLDGGALFDAGAYTLSSLRYLLGEDLSLQFSNVFYDLSYEVDIRGFAVFKKNGIIATSSWGFGLAYSNKIRVWTDTALIEVDRAYSKREEEYDIKVMANGNLLEKIIIPAQNHFVSMLNYFSSCFSDVDKSSACLNDLINQSVFLDKVREWKQ